MKKSAITFILFLFAFVSMAQVSAGFSYQAVVRNNSGEVVACKTVKFRFTILQNSATGTSVFVETQSKATNEFGLANLVVGAGNKVSGNFDPAAWGSNSYYLKVELDPNNGDTFSHLGTMQLMAVPYAFHSKTVEEVGNNSVTSAKIVDGTIVTADLANSAVTSAKVSNNAITEAKIAAGAVTGAKMAQGGATAGQALKWNGTTWAPATDETGESTADNLGNHTATQNIRTNGHWISGDGENEGIFVMDNGKVGIGLDRPGMSTNPGFIGLFESRYNDQGAAIIGSNTYTGTQVNYGGWFEANGTSNATGVFAKSSSRNGIGVRGRATGDSGIGVAGSSDGSEGKGVSGISSDTEGVGVYGSASSTGGLRNYGGYFLSKGEAGIGVYGLADYSSSSLQTSYGGFFQSDGENGTGAMGKATGAKGWGVKGEATNGIGVLGEGNGNMGRGVYGHTYGNEGCGVKGIAWFSSYSTKNNYGGYFESYGRLGRGVFASATGEYGRAVYAISTGEKGYGITAYSDNIAGYFGGNVTVVGTLSKSAGSFKIDHPDDPENKYLQHSFVESPDMMNIYNGNAILDQNGEAVIELPGYFESLNIDYRYQLTAIGAP